MRRCRTNKLLGVNWMSLDQIALLAEIIGGIAVVATLFYLVVEVKRNTVATQSSAQYSQIASMSDWNLALVHAPGLPELIAKANEDYSTITPAEQLKLQGYYVNVFNLWHAAYNNWKKGLLDDDGFRVWNEGTPMALNAQTACAKAWESLAHVYGEEFKKYVESTIETQDILGQDSPVAWTKPTSNDDT